MFKLSQVWASLFLILSACTSIQFSRYEQAVLVQTPQPGAQIWSGSQYLGQTPAYVLLRRAKHAKLDLNYPGHEKEAFELQTKYRWSDSFLPNLLGGILFPALLGVDLYTETAWQFNPVEGFDLKNVNKNQAKSSDPSQWIVAISPPQTLLPRESDLAAANLESYFRKNRPWKIKSFNETIVQFENAHFTNRNIPAQAHRGELYARLKVTHVLESQQENAPGVRTYVLRDVFTGEPIESGTAFVPLEKSRPFALFWGHLATLIPNSVTMDGGKRKLELDPKNLDPIGIESEPIEGLGEASKLFSAVGLTNLLGPHQNEFTYQFRPVSTFDFSYRNLHMASEGLTIEASDFRMFRFTVAAGLQFNLGFFGGVGYIDYLLGPSYNSVTWSGPYQGHHEGVYLGSLLQIGYYYFVSDRVALRLYARSINESKEAWQMALNKSQGHEVPIDGLISREGGVSLAFYYPEFGRRLRREKRGSP